MNQKNRLRACFCGCPALEELTIEKENDDVHRLHISSPTITRLDLEIHNHNNYCSDKYFEVKLDTPALEYLRLDDFLSRDFSAGMLASLTEAYVELDLNNVLYPCSVLEFVGKLNNVSCLKLAISKKVPDSAWTDSTLSSTEFFNLTKLELSGGWSVLTTFLQNSDNLQVLYVDMVNDHQKWMEPKRVPVCLKYHLRTVRFEDFECSEAEFNTVEYILRNAKVLKRMEILNSSKKKKSKAARKRISLFERASEACQVVFEMEEVCL